MSMNIFTNHKDFYMEEKPMAIEKGSISIHTENIFPIIKKWLYSEKDIFIREIVSNASDAISKRRKLGVMGEEQLPEDFAGKIESPIKYSKHNSLHDALIIKACVEKLLKS